MRRSMTELLRFGAVGLAATAVHLAVLALAVEQLGVPPSPANGAAFICAVSVTYLGQSLWVFSGRSRHGAGQLLRFAASLVLGFLTNVGIMAFSLHVLDLPYQFGFLLGLVLVPGLSFLVNRFWVFNHV